MVSSARRDPGLATRLLGAQVLVVLASALTAWVVALIVGPPLFLSHLVRADESDPTGAAAHAEEAFRSATAIALAIALAAALATALAVSVYVTRRIGRSVAAVSAAAATVARGRYEARVAPPGLGAEFDALTASFNQMAGRLETVESTRRRLLADLAHEMRTPVATLDAYLEGLQDGVTTFDVQTTAMLRTQTHRLARLAEDVSAVSRAEENQLPLATRPLHVASLVGTALATAAARYEAKRVALSADGRGSLPVLLGDADRLGQVLANVLDNALRHTPPGGSVRVGAAPAGDGVELTVADTGEGVAAEHLSRVLERFYRVDAARDRDHGGSGIGLTISKALVEAHGGRIQVDSPGPGRGTTVTLWLPSVPGRRGTR